MTPASRPIFFQPVHGRSFELSSLASATCPCTYPLPFVLDQKVLRVNIIPKRKLETPHGFRFWRLQSAKVDSQKTVETPHGLRFWRLQGAKVDSQKKT